MIQQFDVAVLGNWHLASVTAAVFASHGFRTVWVNHDSAQPWEGFPQAPVMEPGLDERISKARASGNLHHANGFESWRAPKVWMAIDTPVNDRDEVDTAPLMAALEKLKGHGDSLKLLAVSSQVPISFCGSAEEFLEVPVAYIPENLRLGKGIETFESADRTVIGAQKEESIEAVKAWMAKFKTEFFTCDLVTAEMVKHATNVFLATSISFSNEIARIGEEYGVDAVKVGKALKLDKRIGQAAYVIPGLGFAGGTLPRDIRILQKIAAQKNIPSPLLNAVMSVNEATTDVICEQIEKQVASSPGYVLILGYTYKPDTDTLRRSLSVDVAKRLSEKKIKCLGFDPMMNEKDFSSIKPYLERHIAHWEDVPATGISGVVLLTARPSFKDIDWASKKWSEGTLVLDAQNFLDAANFTSKAWSYKRLWQKRI
jgi:UDPglucose 6-dehydrogenase